MYVFQKDFCPDLYLIQHVVLKFYLLPNIAIAYLSQPYKWHPVWFDSVLFDWFKGFGTL